MAERLAGEPNNSKFDTERPAKEVTTTTIGDKTRLDNTSTLYDSDGNIVDIPVVDNNEGANIRTSNINTESTQNEILKQLKIMNLHLAILTDTIIKKTEVE